MRILCLFLLLGSFSLSATQLTPEHFRQLRQTAASVNLQSWLKQSELFEDKLQAFNVNEQVLLRSNLLKLLSRQGSSAEHKSWVESQVLSKQVLTTTDTDHPRKRLQLVNIAREARAVLKQWKTQELAQQYLDLLQSQSWEWQQFELSKIDDKFQALALAFKQLEIPELNRAAEQAKSVELLSNASLYQLAIATRDSTFFQRLWLNKSDQYSYRLLQQTAALLPEEFAIKSLQQASSNPKLISQAYQLLARHFVNKQQVQDYLLNALQDKSKQWFAAAAVGNMRDSGLSERVLQIFEQQPTVALQFTLQQLKGGQQ